MTPEAAGADRPTRSELAQAELIHEDGPHKPRVFRVVRGDRVYAVKDIAAIRGVRRRLWRWWLRREARVYAALQGIGGIAVCHGRLDRDALVLQFLEGSFLRRETRDRQAPDFFVRLRQIVDAIHRRGFVHLDLGHRRNILVLADGGPAVVDLAGALPWARIPILGTIGRAIDRRAVRRLAMRYSRPDSL
jgi:tRNA A-37 threonylcarbamoyl transferase component Bud32